MALNNAQLWKQVQVLGRRNIAILAPALQKATDPIQQLFVNKIRECKSASVSGGLANEMKVELERVAKQYGGGQGVDMAKFPDVKFTEPAVDPIDSSNKWAAAAGGAGHAICNYTL